MIKEEITEGLVYSEAQGMQKNGWMRNILEGRGNWTSAFNKSRLSGFEVIGNVGCWCSLCPAVISNARDKGNVGSSVVESTVAGQLMIIQTAKVRGRQGNRNSKCKLLTPRIWRIGGRKKD